MTTEEIRGLSGKLSRFLGQFEDCFATYRGHAHLRTYVEGQLGPLPRKSVEPIADAAGIPSRTLQEFLGLHRWNEGAVRDRLQRYLARTQPGPEAIVIVDETSFPKRGTATACVQRQYCGATGKVDNCVVAVHTVYAQGDFHTLLDATLYLPETTWADPARRAQAGIAADAAYQPLHALALAQLARARTNRVPMAWVTADERYGEVPAFLAQLEAWGVGYVVEVPSGVTGWLQAPEVWASREAAGAAGAGLRTFPRVATDTPAPQPVAALRRAHAFGRQSWTPYRVKDTEKGPEVWEVRTHAFWQHREGTASPPLQLLVVRHVLDGTEKTFLAWSPVAAPVETLLRVAFTRWRVERAFEDAKGELGLDHFEVRGYRAITRHLVASAVSYAFLATQRARLGGKNPGADDLPAPDGLRPRA